MSSLHKPLGFGGILDQTFTIIKSHFKPLFLISFLISVPIYLIHAIILALDGKNLLIGAQPAQNFFNQITNNIDSFTQTTWVEDISGFVSFILILFATPLIAGATIHGIQKVRSGETFTAKEMIKMAMPRYWPMFWSLLLISLIVMGIVFIPIFLIGITIAILAVAEPVIAIIAGILISLGTFIGSGLLLSRWSLFLPCVLFDKVAPGLSKSWRLTKKQTWKFFGLFILLFIITSIISSVLQIPLVFLGNSIVSQFLTNVISMVTNIVLLVGYAVMYFDASLRYDATDLKEMIQDYDTTEQP
ncbi:hypothetical protein [Gracilibacillus sp. YIM 98692]|uniref:hypothetical protein n=1 Tax=Gracilibacillus sp. YIM 98692 TaxID=2663532 RepID=UPI0013D4858A|nr:hypothetical protein [Gracilibacillus sp. YIM 98692]